MDFQTKLPGTERLLALLGSSIRTRRGEIGESQESLANRIGIDRTYYSSVEAGRRNVSFINLCRIADGLDATPSDLIQNIGWSALDGK
jgi:transcriptional regulator with XRE-family HTH domain